MMTFYSYQIFTHIRFFWIYACGLIAANCGIVFEIIYLGSLVTNTDDCSQVIKRRIQFDRTAMSQLVKIRSGRNIHNQDKISLVNSLVFPVFSYSAVTWTIRQVDSNWIDAFELFCWRRMLHIPWTARQANVSIIKEIKHKMRHSSIVYTWISQ